MAVHVTLVQDALKGEGALKPRVVQPNPVGMDLLLSYMADGSALETVRMRSAVSRLEDALVFYLAQGGKVTTPFGTFYLSARGTYADGETPRVEKRNLGINFRPAPELLETLRRSTKIVMEDSRGRRVPSIMTVVNVETAETTDGGKAGQIIKIQGGRLSFDPADVELGVFLMAEDGTEHRMEVYSRTGSSQVDFKIAKVPVGAYTLEVRTRPTDKDVWVGLSPRPFTVKS
jgi:hypothetical protein